MLALVEPISYWTTVVDRPYREGEFRGQRKELVARDTETERPKVLPERLDPDDIVRAEAVFQPRDTSLAMNAGHSKRHVKTLAKSASDGRDLDPVAIVAFGDGWYLVDGHHRLEAYVRAGRKGPVPVKVYDHGAKGEARVAWAMALSTSLNSKEKLPMSGRDKADAAWRMTVFGGMTKVQISAASRASTSSIASMRRHHTALSDSGNYGHEELQAMTWSEATWRLRTLDEDDSNSKFGDEDAKRRLLIRRLAPNFNAHVPTGRLLYALEELKPGVTEELRDILVMDPDGIDL